MKRRSQDKKLTSSTTSLKHNMLSSRINNFDEDQIEKDSLPFDFKDKQILHLWLVSILPGNKYAKCQIDLRNKKIQGNFIECERKIEECRKHLDKYSMKSLTDLSNFLTDNMQMAIQIKFNAKIFEKSTILEAIEQIFKKYKYKQILAICQTIQNNQYFYLISLEKFFDQDFVDWYEENKDREFNKYDISRIRSQSQMQRCSDRKLPACAEEKPMNKKEEKVSYYNSLINKNAVDEQKQSSVEDEPLDNNQETPDFYKFYQKDEKKQKQKSKESSEKTYEKVQETEAKKKKYVRKYYDPKQIDKEECNYVRKPTKMKTIFKKEINQKNLNEGILKNWIKNNKALKWQQIQLEHKDRSIIIRLLSSEENEEKVKAIKIFFEFEKVVLLDSSISDSQIKLIEKQFVREGILSCRLVQGFMEPSTHEHKLRNLINQGKITKYGRRNQKFSAFFIVGMKHEVDDFVKDIRDFRDRLPAQDIIEQLFLNLKDIQRYIYLENIKYFLTSSLTQYLKKYQKQLTLEQISFTINKAVLKVKIKHNQYENFIINRMSTVIEDISKCVTINQIFQEDLYFQDICKKFLIVKSETSAGKYVLISETSKSNSLIKDILHLVNQEKYRVEDRTITFKKSRLLALKKFISTILDGNKLMEGSLKAYFPSQDSLKLCGCARYARQIETEAKNFLRKHDEEAMEKTFFINEEAAGVVEKNMAKFKQSVEQQFGLSFELSKNIDLGVLIYIGSDSRSFDQPLSIIVEKSRNIDRLPNNSVVFFQSQNDLTFFSGNCLTDFKAHLHGVNKSMVTELRNSTNDMVYVYSEGFNDSGEIMKMLWDRCPSTKSDIRTFAFIMPKKDKKKFVLGLLACCEEYLKKVNKIRVHIFEDTTQDLRKSLQNLKDEYMKPEKQYKYYVVDKKQFYYSKQGDDKIKKALDLGKQYAYLTNEDLNLENKTHNINLNQKKIVHIQSATQSKIQKLGDGRYLFTVKGTQFFIPDKQIKIAEQELLYGNQTASISVGAYQLDLVKMKQTNMFSNYTRDLLKKQQNSINKPAGNVIINFDEKCNEIEIGYEKKDEVKAIKACDYILKLIEDERVRVDHCLEKPMTKEQFQMLRTAGEEVGVKVEIFGESKIGFSGFDKNTITYLQKNIKLFQIEQQVIKFPSTWCPQKNDIETFIVPQNSKQYLDIQKAFAISPIKELIRIQNRLVYKKYEDEKECLTKLNEGKAVKQAMLFHGTRSADPKVIYEDKEESFNINYTSDGNYLGRGTYFAVQAQYSNAYAYVSKIANLFGFGIGGQTKEMFYCSVLIGDSETLQSNQYDGNKRDTNFKDVNKRIRYESATTYTNGSTIYTVYKNRRAYPHYLIKY